LLRIYEEENMKPNSNTLFFGVLSCLLLVLTAAAQHHGPDSGRATGPLELGTIDFPTSGPANAQKHFIEGMLLLHSFEYGRARQSFQEASKIAPDFAMAYWGEAMTHDHPIWGEQDRRAALASLAKLAATPAERRAKAPTEREKMYFDAVEQLYREGSHAEIAAAYSKAMEAITKRFPDDLEARALYALSLLGLTGTTRNTDNYMRAAAVAEEIYERNPKHPGALHYLIHSYDDPVHAPLGLRAARVYGTVARGASHAQHMPSHIFFALGMWEDAVKANIASMKTARDAGSGGYHPLHWLVHTYPQLGRDDEAYKLLAVLEDDMKREPSPAARTHLAMCRATILVESPGKGPASLLEPVDSTGISMFGVFAGHDLAAGLEYVRQKDLERARQSLARLKGRTAGKSVRTDSTDTVSRYNTVSQSDLDATSVMEQILDAAIQFAAGDREGGIRKIQSAAEAEDKLIFEYGPPAIPKPAWEAAGEMLLAAGRKDEAAKAFRNTLKRYPNRRLSNEGLRAATGQAGS
jgi:tetratricopeptide (TPR) repeat protein